MDKTRSRLNLKLSVIEEEENGGFSPDIKEIRSYLRDESIEKKKKAFSLAPIACSNF